MPVLNSPIGEGELAKFIQPSENSAVLNRVIGNQLSTLLGRLESNGEVYLINPQGILFGENAVIDTASFLVSTLDLTNAEFLARGDLTFQGDSKQKIINYGTIRGWNGDVTLISYQVENHGSLEAPNGVVSIGSGQEILLKPHGKERIFVRATGKKGEDGVGIHNRGTIQAIQAELKADGNPYAYATNQEGLIEANGLVQREGRVLLVAEEGVNIMSGMIIAQNENQTGGTVHILGLLRTGIILKNDLD